MKTIDYKPTLHLPVTDFPMKANLSVREPEILKHWENIQLYQQMRKIKKNKPKFILPDGPIYANGDIHIGHALNRILKDIIVKSKTLAGFDAPFVPGWDCHGLPVELNVEKKYGKAGEKIDFVTFRAKCREYAHAQIVTQRKSFKRLGVLGDWDKPYTTMDFPFEANIFRALGKMIQKGHLQRGFKPVHWCTDCQSALAEAEVEYQDKNSPAIDIKFPVNNTGTETFPGYGKIFIAVWTTTPWTLPANEAVALNPTQEYVLIQVNTERLIIAKALLADCCARYSLLPENYTELGILTRKDLQGLTLIHPMNTQKEIPVIFGEHVTTDTGTGAVHTAPAHGLEDYLIGQVYGLPMNNPVNEKGCFKPETPYFAGEFVLTANQWIIEKLAQKNHLLANCLITHSYPHCWRHKTPVIFLATPQWFISMDKHHLRTHALATIEQTQFIPEWGKSRMAGMVSNRPDWCISRQRQWCTPMGLIIDKKTGALHPDMPNLIEKIALIIEKSGIDAWYSLDLALLLSPEEMQQYKKSHHTLDVWFDSGVVHFATLKDQMADLYLEGSDQHRGWFQSSLLTSVAMKSTAPYKTVLTHGFVVDDQGRKMSKSLGNVISPETVVNTLGADVLRLWVAATDYQTEIAVSQEILTRTSEAYRRIRNTLRFLLANLHDFEPDQHMINTENLLLLDKFILEKAENLQKEIFTAYQDYAFHLIYQKLHNFCVVELGGFYLDIIKDRQYTMQKNSIGRRSAQTVIYHLLQAMTRWIAPILSFTAEEIWQHLPQKTHISVFLTEFYDLSAFNYKINNKNNININFNQIIDIREAVNKALEAKRAQGEIKSSLEAHVMITAPKNVKDNLEKLGHELRFIFICSKVSIAQNEQPSDTDVNIRITGLSDYKKCARCWHRCSDIGQHAEHPDICTRCISNLPDHPGEIRYYA